LEYAPVCGCDGDTYGNECAADGAGVSVFIEGNCDDFMASPCGGPEGPECAAHEACYFEEGDCGESGLPGFCSPGPELGPDTLDPVCGCDGLTYLNSNDAGIRGMSLRHQGACEGDSCGGLQGLACPEDKYCYYEPGTCGAADQSGVCFSIPSACMSASAPVCGCDDQTYDNECRAAQAGVSVQSRGTCKTFCGGENPVPCGEGAFCKFEPAGCGGDDSPGVCTSIPDVCIGESAPVCGCDHQTYSNECFADMAGVSVQSEGECP